MYHYNHGRLGFRQHNEANSFECTGCKTLGFGERHSCNMEGCNAELHRCCAYYSRAPVRFFMHPQHDLLFMMRPAVGWTIICNVCSEPVRGCFYGCCSCLSFDVHPVCAQLPETLSISDGVHPGHKLKYERKTYPEACSAGCGYTLGEWRYRCDDGCVGADFHLECLRGPDGGPVGVPPSGYGLPKGFASRGVLNGQGGYAVAGRRRKWDAVFAIFTVLNTGSNIWSFVSWIPEMLG